ncbi:MAG: alanine--glyoxylate aminotransferase family protein [Candidatus Methylacidiphilales bacterium]
MSHPKLFIPGPVQVSAKTYEAFCRPMIGHRSKAFQELYAAVQPGLQALFQTRQPVFLCTGSAWCVMEAAIRNLVRQKVLVCMSGAFSDKWFDVARKCGKAAEKLQVEWGQAIKPEAVRAALARGEFDAITLIHNETSTGTMNPLKEIAAVVREFPDVMLITDVVSSFTVVPTPFDELGADVMLAGVQKALALPPGVAVFTVSERAFARCAEISDRGYYMDFLEFKKNAESNMTPTTPSISHLYALQSKVEEILAEGLEARYARHAATNRMVRDWARTHGFDLFPEAGYESVSLTCIRNNREIDVAALAQWMKANANMVIDQGYGKVKGKTFRLSNMGDETEATVGELLANLDRALAALT